MCGFYVWLADHITFGTSDRRIPLLREIYEQFPETPVNIDIKVNDDELIRKVSLLFCLFDRCIYLHYYWFGCLMVIVIINSRDSVYGASS